MKTELSKKLKEEIKNFNEEIFKNGHIIDPNDEKDWNDMAYGYLRAKGISHEEANNWNILSAMTCGKIFD